MAEKKKVAHEDILAKYQDGTWHDKPLYRSPIRPAYTTIDREAFLKHLISTGALRKKKA